MLALRGAPSVIMWFVWTASVTHFVPYCFILARNLRYQVFPVSHPGTQPEPAVGLWHLPTCLLLAQLGPCLCWARGKTFFQLYCVHTVACAVCCGSLFCRCLKTKLGRLPILRTPCSLLSRLFQAMNFIGDATTHVLCLRIGSNCS